MSKTTLGGDRTDISTRTITTCTPTSIFLQHTRIELDGISVEERRAWRAMSASLPANLKDLKENAMKNRIVTASVILGALMLPAASHAQVIAGTIVGGALGGPVGAVAGAIIGGINAGALNDYVATHTYHTYVYTGNVVVGAPVPAGVTYYRVPTD